MKFIQQKILTKLTVVFLISGLSINSFAVGRLSSQTDESETAWEPVGVRAYNTTKLGSSVSMAVNLKTNQLFLLYSATNNNNHPQLEAYNETTDSWIVVDNGKSGITNTPTKSNRIMSDVDGNLYTAHIDTMYNSGTASVLKYDGESWSYVGNRGFSQGVIGYMWIGMQSGKVPYVLFPETNYEGGKESMMRFNEQKQSWEYVGKRGFSPAYASEGAFTFDPVTQQPYAVFIDNGNSGAARVMTYRNGEWVDVGQQPCTGAMSSNARITISPNNQDIYIAYGTGSSANVMRFSHDENWSGTESGSEIGQWELVGNHLSSGIVKDTSFIFNALDDKPILAFVDTSANQSIQAQAYNYNINSWTSLGTPSLTYRATEVTTAGLNSFTNKLYYAFPDISGVIQVVKQQ